MAIKLNYILNNWAVDFMVSEKVSVEPKPINNVKLVNFLPQHELNYMLECINKGYEELEFSNELEKLGSGYFGTVFGYKNYAIKINRDDEMRDGEILSELQHIQSVMKLYAIIDDKAIISERVDGVMVQEYLNNGYQNFISPYYKEVYENDLKKILFAGWNADDLHNSNVMISRATGLPVIVDVGFFERIPKMNYNSHEEIDLTEFWSTKRALHGSQLMDKYVSIKKEELSKIKSVDNFNPKVIRQLELNIHIA